MFLACIQLLNPPQTVKREDILAEVARQAAPHLVQYTQYQITATLTSITIKSAKPGRAKGFSASWKWSEAATKPTFTTQPNLGKGVRKDISSKALAALLPYNQPGKDETTSSYFSFETQAKGAKVSAFFERLPLTPGAHTVIIVSQEGKVLRTIPGA